jgi:hypothetical protein
MTYTNHTAGMTLATARDMLARLEAGWTADQLARARAVVRHWERIRRNQTEQARINWAQRHGNDSGFDPYVNF